ncbi:hypothetical protein TREMEDRAFT_17977, partial [Tremella mesenterica DSM 1558]|uniref:uncharacterized protein n=1 Tax=Tremella mesenterica (strain ATCC 24925 / CBS 8224 / DSM 1558 / NBRC 9311 / NRRL Y-6157 / RJB 2259-6 / UBC 559-6) TaxID=578456 RepID=UPI0003F49B4E
THTRPDLTEEQQELISKIIRVDQAGELGANWIYRGQKWASLMRGDLKTAKDVEEMWENEKHHLHITHLLQKQHHIRPTLLYPVWQGLAFFLGASTGLAGREAAMACTEAVETVIGEHYDDQLKALQPLISPSPSSSLSNSTPDYHTSSQSMIDSSSLPVKPHPSLPLLANIIREFRDDELEHLDIAVEGGAQKAPGHAFLSAVVGLACKVAIKVCERV